MVAYLLSFILLMYFVKKIYLLVIVAILFLALAPKVERMRLLLSILIALFVFNFVIDDKINLLSEQSTVLSKGYAYRVCGNCFDFYPSKLSVRPYRVRVSKFFILPEEKFANAIEGNRVILDEAKIAKNINRYQSSGYISGINVKSAYFYNDNSSDFIYRRFISSIYKYLSNKRYLLSDVAGDLYSALVMGKINYDENFANIVKTRGVINLFVISGFHFSIIAGFLIFLLNKILKINYNNALFIAFTILTIYFSLLGSGFGATRAYIMICLSYIAFFSGRSSDGELSLLLISLFWIISFPASVFQIGFVLTILCTFALLILSKNKIFKRIENIHIKNLIASFFISILVGCVLNLFCKTSPVFAFVLIFISSPFILFILPFLFLYSAIPFNFDLLNNIFKYLINTISKIYYNFLISMHGFTELNYNFPFIFSVFITFTFVFYVFSRKLVSYSWDKKSIICLYISLLFICIR